MENQNLGIPPAYYKWSQFDPICTCGNRIAVFQREFEELEKEGLENNLSLQEARINCIKKLGYKRICCIRGVTNFTKNFICDTKIDAYSDVTYSSSGAIKTNNRMKTNPTEIGYEFLPRTRSNLGFDQQQYCEKISHLSLSNFKKIERNQSEESKAIAIFPNYRINKRQNAPTIESEIKILTNEELTLNYLK